MQRPGKIKDVRKKIHARAKKMLYHGIGGFVWAMTVDKERFVVAAKNSVKVEE